MPQVQVQPLLECGWGCRFRIEKAVAFGVAALNQKSCNATWERSAGHDQAIIEAVYDRRDRPPHIGFTGPARGQQVRPASYPERCNIIAEIGLNFRDRGFVGSVANFLDGKASVDLASSLSRQLEEL
ncbi:hypothetical protein, partial [uncultured Ruegeria sp.]|uniref:hypothetical protein n=1 Tax=uncultured Ruegeria sp. TaxID=259304 RepID=UPI0026077B79